MSLNLRKRKQRPFDNDLLPQPDTSLYIQAYEADLVRGPQAKETARSLEPPPPDHDGDIGRGLIAWGGEHKQRDPDSLSEDADTFHLGHSDEKPAAAAPRDRETRLWMDRYDARLLLDALPQVAPPVEAPPEPGSPGGWSDLPSDTEDAFFLTAEETEDVRREKRRRTIDRDRDARLRALRAEGEEAVPVVDERASWGGSDEEPDEPQRELMRRTAEHVLASPNPAQLEMRILANHGADPRFAFLRGRWARAWQILKGRTRLERQRAAEASAKPAGLGGLSGYGDSSDESSEEGAAEVPPPPPPPVEAQPSEENDPEDEDALKEARRARARAWAEKRRALKERVDSDVEGSPRSR